MTLTVNDAYNKGLTLKLTGIEREQVRDFIESMLMERLLNDTLQVQGHLLNKED